MDIHRRLRERDARLTRFAKRHPKAAAEVVNALARVRHLRGEPDEYPCQGCATAPAEEWQLVELSRREGPEFLLYSDEPEHYSPFCSPCALDAEDDRNQRLDRIWGRTR
ncbi:hypothetical protein [Streptomyces sp. NBC_00299]|uniref:hypothetical protein n=1 Tax=Streptomyces sp. NBC_00299 TaxID=2975705 RepID=UPI002E284D4F|nr:hypothetical protein [Streptomyces sp. NBC_00299]